MKLVVFASPQEQARGLLDYATVPRDTLFLFPRITSRTLTTVGLREPIQVMFLDGEFRPIGFGGGCGMLNLLWPGETLVVPDATQHVVEAAQGTPILPHLSEIRRGIWVPDYV